MYTVQEVYDKTLVEADKMGSDYLTLPEALIRFKKSAYDFLGQKAAEVEETQEVTQDIQKLVKVASITPVSDPNITGTFLAAFPTDYYQRLRVTVFYSDTEKSRLPRFQKFGEANTNLANPYKKPSREYPLITNYSDYFNVDAKGAIPTKVALTYLQKPLFGTAANLSGVMLDLPISAVDIIISMMTSEWLVDKGDQRAQPKFQIKETSRKPR